MIISAEMVSIPVEPRLFELLWEALLPGVVEFHPRVQAWYDATITQEANARMSGFMRDVDLGFPATDLRPYQRVGAHYLHTMGRAILADECGLGKTVQAISAVRASHATNTILVLCTKAMRTTWEEEIEHWHPGSNVYRLEANMRDRVLDVLKGKHGYFLLTWECLHFLPKLTQSGPWDWIIADEAQRLKNHKTQTYELLEKVPTRYLALLTGTPIQNAAYELWPIFHLIDPKRWPSYWRFYEMYVDYTVDPVQGFRMPHGAKHEDLVARDLSTVMLQRTKEQVAPELPPKTYIDIPVDLADEQRTMYRDAVKNARIALTDGSTRDLNSVLSQMLALRMVTSSTAVIDQQAEDISTKMDAAMDLIENDPQDSFVVFVQFRAGAACMMERLRHAGISYAGIIGGMSPAKLDEAKTRFQEGQARVLVCTLDAGGTGLTLTRSHKIIFIEKHYNPAKQTQAEDRIHRIGQTETCVIYTIRCRRTVDDAVEAILSRKVQMQTEIMREYLLQMLK